MDRLRISDSHNNKIVKARNIPKYHKKRIILHLEVKMKNSIEIKVQWWLLRICDELFVQWIFSNDD